MLYWTNEAHCVLVTGRRLDGGYISFFHSAAGRSIGRRSLQFPLF